MLVNLQEVFNEEDITHFRRINPECEFSRSRVRFFDELLKPPPQKRKTEQNNTQKSQQQDPGLLEGLGGLFGAEKKDIDLLKKRLGVV